MEEDVCVDELKLDVIRYDGMGLGLLEKRKGKRKKRKSMIPPHLSAKARIVL